MQAKILHDIHRLLVVTYIMAKAFVIVDPQNVPLSFQLPENGAYPRFCTPRMANRQLKYHFLHLHVKYMGELLNKLQQIFRSSKGTERWLAAFVIVLGLAIANEEMQKLAPLVTDAQIAASDPATLTNESGYSSKEDAEQKAEKAGKEIDDGFRFIMKIFRWKYCRSGNPLRDGEREGWKEWTERLRDERVIRFLQQISSLVGERCKFLNIGIFVHIMTNE
jgi:hypothetical protein